MSAIGTIVVHLAEDDRRTDRLMVGLELGRRYGAHVVALYDTAPTHMPAGITGRGASFAYLAEAHRLADERAAKARAEAERLCSAGQVSWSWVVDEAETTEELVSHYARLADLLIVGQNPAHLDEALTPIAEPEKAVLTATCPVLVLPAKGSYEGIGRRILVAWKDSREAVRALRESMGALEQAEEVVVLSVASGREDPTASVVEYLARRGVKARGRVVPDQDPGEAILAAAATLDCDLIVMGAYGRSRMREFLFGGATRHLLQNSDRALLMAH